MSARSVYYDLHARGFDQGNHNGKYHAWPKKALSPADRALIRKFNAELMQLVDAEPLPKPAVRPPDWGLPPPGDGVRPPDAPASAPSPRTTRNAPPDSCCPY